MKLNVIIPLLVAVFISSYCLSSDGKNDDKAEISVEQVLEKTRTDSTIFLLDVRTEPEFDGELGHVEGAVLIPLSELESRLGELTDYKEREIIVICRSGNRSGQATKILRANGYKAMNMLGGMRAWNALMESANKSNTGN